MIKVYTGTGKILMAPCSLNIVLGESIVLLRIIKYLNSYQVIKRELDYISNSLFIFYLELVIFLFVKTNPNAINSNEPKTTT